MEYLLGLDPTNNDAALLLPDGYLPTASDRPDDEAPSTDLMGRLFADPGSAVVAGDGVTYEYTITVNNDGPYTVTLRVSDDDTSTDAVADLTIDNQILKEAAKGNW